MKKSYTAKYVKGLKNKIRELEGLVNREKFYFSWETPRELGVEFCPNFDNFKEGQIGDNLNIKGVITRLEYNPKTKKSSAIMECKEVYIIKGE